MKKTLVLISLGASLLLGNNLEQRDNFSNMKQNNQMQQNKDYHTQNIAAEKQRIISNMDDRKDCVSKAVTQDDLRNCHDKGHKHNESQRRINEQYSK